MQPAIILMGFLLLSISTDPKLVFEPLPPPEIPSAIPPGATLRRVISNTVRRQVESRIKTLNKQQPSDIKWQKIQSSYADDTLKTTTTTATSTNAQASSRKAKSPQKRPNNGPTPVLKSVSSPAKSSARVPLSATNNNSNNNPAATIPVSTIDWLTAAAAAADASSLPSLKSSSSSSGNNSGGNGAFSRGGGDRTIVIPRTSTPNGFSRPSSETRFASPGADAHKTKSVKGKTLTQDNTRLYGTSLLVDVPDGLDDSVAHLLRAAALRCYVPSFYHSPSPSPSTSDRRVTTMGIAGGAAGGGVSEGGPVGPGTGAYEMYLQLPFGLAKVKYEQEARAWCEEYIQQLASLNITTISDLLPLEKGHMILTDLDLPPPLLDMTMMLINDLQSLHSFAKGGRSTQVTQDLQDVLKRQARKEATDIKTDEAGKGSSTKASPPKPTAFQQWILSTNKHNPTHTSPTQTNSTDTTDNTDSKALTSLLNDLDSDPIEASRLLCTLLEPGIWQKAESPVDDLIRHCVFLLAPDEITLPPTSPPKPTPTISTTDNLNTTSASNSSNSSAESYAQDDEGGGDGGTGGGGRGGSGDSNNSNKSEHLHHLKQLFIYNPAEHWHHRNFISHLQTLNTLTTIENKKLYLKQRYYRCQTISVIILTFLKSSSSSLNINTVYDLMTSSDEDLSEFYENIPVNMKYQLEALLALCLQVYQSNLLATQKQLQSRHHSQQQQQLQSQQLVSYTSSSDSVPNSQPGSPHRSGPTLAPLSPTTAYSNSNGVKARSTKIVPLSIRPPSSRPRRKSPSKANTLPTTATTSFPTTASPTSLSKDQTSAAVTLYQQPTTQEYDETVDIITYDPRYQRSPYDPYGKPRGNRQLKPLGKNRPEKTIKKGTSADLFVPGGIWDRDLPTSTTDPKDTFNNDDSNNNTTAIAVGGTTKATNKAILFNQDSYLYTPTSSSLPSPSKSYLPPLSPQHTNTANSQTNSSNAIVTVANNHNNIYTTPAFTPTNTAAYTTMTLQEALAASKANNNTNTHHTTHTATLNKHSNTHTMPTNANTNATTLTNTQNNANTTTVVKPYNIDDAITNIRDNTHEYIKHIRTPDTILLNNNNTYNNTYKYICQYPGCTHSFNRLYTLSIHIKTHKYCQSYYNYNNAPQLSLDPTGEKELDQMI